MYYLDFPSRKLEVVLAGAVATNQAEITAHYFTHTPQQGTTLNRGGWQRSTTNNTTDVTIVDAPALQGWIKNIHSITIHNKDSAPITVTVKMDDGGTETILIKQTLSSGESMVYETDSGWQVLTPITPPFTDTTAIVKGSSDATKLLRIEVDGLTPTTTRVITVPDSNTTLPIASQVITWNGPTTARTYTLPDAADTIATLAATQELDNKTLDSSVAKGTWTASGTWTVPALTLGGTVTSNGQSFSGTIANLGAVTTVDINGGTIDGATIGASSAAAITGTTITGNAFVPNSETVPTNGMYLAGANILGFSTNGLLRQELHPAGTDDIGSLISRWVSIAGATHFFQAISAQGFNGTNSGFLLGKDNTTGRSLNSGGTINASGADYAEYERKRDDCGEIAKGDIVGFDEDGLVTDKWTLAMTFGVKSTNPSYVGGDTWGTPDKVGALPIEPVEPVLRTQDAEALERYQAEREAWTEAVEAYRTERSAFVARLEVERAKVDRIAYSGKVPANVTGAQPGQWIVPAKDGAGIKGVAVNAFDPDAVGRVRRILPDGRAEIAVTGR